VIDKNKIPKDWPIKKLEEVCKLKNGYAFKSNDYKSKGIPVIRISDINYGIVSHNRAVRVTANKEYENYVVENDDILVAMSGATTGKFGIYKSKDKAYQNQRVGKFKILDKGTLNNQFLYHQINSLKRQIEKDAYGGAQPNISSTKIEQMQIVVPPLPEQLTIVSKIEELFSDLDKGIESLTIVRQQLKIYRQSLLKYAFEGKLTNKNVKEGELPNGWKWVKINDLAAKNKHSLKAGPFGSSLKKEFYVKDGYKIYGQEQVINGDAFYGNYFISLEKYEELISNKIQPFDILISLVGTVGKVLILPENCIQGIINPRLIKISLNREIYLPKFFKYYFESAYVKNLYSSKAQGTTMDVLNMGIIKTIPFPLPPFEEQQRIVDELESKLTICDKIEETITNSLKQSETLRQSILKKAFEGNLVPQNPNIDPSTKML
jgi:type I restriction enzyme S subunit